MHGIVQQPFLGVLDFGDVGERADQRAPPRRREPTTGRAFSANQMIMAVRRAQPEILHQPPAALLQHAVERGAEAVAVERMQHFEPVRRRAFQRAALEAEQAARSPGW